MRQLRVLAAAVVSLAIAAAAVAAADATKVVAVQGTVDKFDKEVLTFSPRTSDGKFGKAVALQVTGTSKITTLIPQNRGGKTIYTQKDTDAKDLVAKQPIAVIYTDGPNPVLLTAVVQSEK